MYQYTAKQISQKLNDNIHDVLRRLLPNGKEKHHEWHVGSIRGEVGESMLVRMEGAKKGLWCDFSTGGEDKGDLLDLWAATRAITLREAIIEARHYLGISDDKIERPERNKYVRPTLTEGVKAAAGKVFDYLTLERKLSSDTLKTFGVLSDGNVIIFPYYRAKELTFVKYLKLERVEGKKRPWTSENSEPCLFGWQATSGRSRKLVLTEGEVDTMTLHQYGIGMDVMSIPFGGGKGGKQQWIETEYDNLNVYDEIYLCFDNDEKGQIAAKDVTDRLGSHRCRIVTLPFKDANECLQKGVTPDVIQQCFDRAQTIDPRELKRAQTYSDQIKKGINHASQEELGYSLPWDKAFNTINFRAGELTVWSGINGHGKSQILGYLMLDQLTQGANVCIASFELQPVKTLMRMTRQAGGLKQPSDEYIDRICDWWSNQLWVFDLVGTAKADRLIEVFKYARQRYGIDVFVIDSLMKCGFADDDYASQKKFLDQLSDFKNQFNCHIHIVAHPRKVQDEKTPPSKLDIKGVSGITDLADNCMIVWRNKPKETKIGMDKATGTETSTEDLKRPDCRLMCAKQRFGDWEGIIPLWFDIDSLQYLGRYEDRPKQMVDYSRSKQNF